MPPAPLPPQPDPDPDGEFDRLAVVTIQGGGVFGLSLLGQLQAVHEARLLPVALAGTSAGAIVATLYWAGLSPTAVRDHFAALTNTPGGLVDLVGPFDRAGQRFDFGSFETWAGRLQSYVRWARGLVDTKSGVGRQALKHMALAPAYLVGAPAHAPALFRFLGDTIQATRLVGLRGIFPGCRFEWELDRMLRASPIVARHADLLPPAPDGPRTARRVFAGPHPDGPRLLTFGDFGRLARERGEFFPYLMLTATNLSRRRLELFNSVGERYHHLPVASAVRVSAGFPGFFQPVDVDFPDAQYSYVDGGVICNFPAFVFNHAFRARLLNPAPAVVPFRVYASRPWVHVGLRLTADDPPLTARGMEDPEAFFGAVKDLLTGAARTDLENRLAEALPRMVRVEQPLWDTGGPGGVLDVKALDRHTIGVMFERGKGRAAGPVRLGFGLPPRAEVEPVLEDLVARAARVFGDPDNSRLRFRANVFLPEGGRLRLVYRANMADPPLNPDRDLAFGFRHGMTGYCLTRRQPVLCNLTRFEARRAADPAGYAERFGPTDTWPVRPDRTWLLSLPVFDPQGSARAALLDDTAAGDPDHAFCELESYLDGAAFGVLNLDAAVDYSAEGLTGPPADQLDDYRVRAVADMMRVAAGELGETFDAAFARPPEEAD